MTAMNILTLVVVIIAGVNGGLVGPANFNLVAAISGDQTTLSRIINVLVGLAALWQIMPLVGAWRVDPIAAHAGAAARRAGVKPLPILATAANAS